MSEPKRGRGRPPKPETLEHVPARVAQQNSSELVEWVASMQRTKDEILSDYHSYPTIPHGHIFELASLGDEALSGHEERILLNDAKLYQDAVDFRHSGGAERRKSTATRDVELCQKNRVLLGRVNPLGPLTLTDAARRIRLQWTCIPPESRAPGEEKLDCRGIVWTGNDAAQIPSIKTILRAIKRASPFEQHREGQSSRPKK